MSLIRGLVIFDAGVYVDALLGLHKTLPLEIWGIIVAYSPWTMEQIEAMCEARPKTFGKLRTGGYLWQLLHATRYTDEHVKQLEGFAYRHFIPGDDAYCLCKMESWQDWFMYSTFECRSTEFSITILNKKIVCHNYSLIQLKIIFEILGIVTNGNVHTSHRNFTAPWKTRKQMTQLLYYMACQGMKRIVNKIETI